MPEQDCFSQIWKANIQRKLARDGAKFCAIIICIYVMSSRRQSLLFAIIWRWKRGKEFEQLALECGNQADSIELFMQICESSGIGATPTRPFEITQAYGGTIRGPPMTIGGGQGITPMGTMAAAPNSRTQSGWSRIRKVFISYFFARSLRDMVDRFRKFVLFWSKKYIWKQYRIYSRCDKQRIQLVQEQE